MQVKDMYLKKYKLILILSFFIFFFQKIVYADDINKSKAIKYLDDLKFFSASFLQNDGSQISEGQIFIGDHRLRVDYKLPSKILIILDKNKAMYYNYDLDEDEFFNPKDTLAGFFFEIFNSLDFINESKTYSNNNNLFFERELEGDMGKYNLKVIFEDNPFLIRKIEIDSEEVNLVLSLYNHNYNENFDENFFKLINPSFFD